MISEPLSLPSTILTFQKQTNLQTISELIVTFHFNKNDEQSNKISENCELLRLQKFVPLVTLEDNRVY